MLLPEQIIMAWISLEKKKMQMQMNESGEDGNTMMTMTWDRGGYMHNRKQRKHHRWLALLGSPT